MLKRKILITRVCLTGLESAQADNQIIRTVTSGIQGMLVKCLEYHHGDRQNALALSSGWTFTRTLLENLASLSSHTDYYFSTEFFPFYTEHFISIETLSFLNKSTPLARVQTSLHWTRKMLYFLRFLQMLTSDFTWYSHSLTSRF